MPQLPILSGTEIGRDQKIQNQSLLTNMCHFIYFCVFTLYPWLKRLADEEKTVCAIDSDFQGGKGIKFIPIQWTHTRPLYQLRPELVQLLDLGGLEVIHTVCTAPCTQVSFSLGFTEVPARSAFLSYLIILHTVTLPSQLLPLAGCSLLVWESQAKVLPIHAILLLTVNGLRHHWPGPIPSHCIYLYPSLQSPGSSLTYRSFLLVENFLLSLVQASFSSPRQILHFRNPCFKLSFLPITQSPCFS